VDVPHAMRAARCASTLLGDWHSWLAHLPSGVWPPCAAASLLQWQAGGEEAEAAGVAGVAAARGLQAGGCCHLVSAALSSRHGGKAMAVCLKLHSISLQHWRACKDGVRRVSMHKKCRQSKTSACDLHSMKHRGELRTWTPTPPPPQAAPWCPQSIWASFAAAPHIGGWGWQWQRRRQSGDPL
jgi:hypothetical protein